MDDSSFIHGEVVCGAERGVAAGWLATAAVMRVMVRLEADASTVLTLWQPDASTVGDVKAAIAASGCSSLPVDAMRLLHLATNLSDTTQCYALLSGARGYEVLHLVCKSGVGELTLESATPAPEAVDVPLDAVIEVDVQGATGTPTLKVSLRTFPDDEAVKGVATIEGGRGGWHVVFRPLHPLPPNKTCVVHVDLESSETSSEAEGGASLEASAEYCFATRSLAPCRVVAVCGSKRAIVSLTRRGE